MALCSLTAGLYYADMSKTERTAAAETAAAAKKAVITEKRNRKAGMTMTDVIILLIILMVLIYGVKGTIKHFKGEGACCGGGSGPVKAKRKVLKNPKIGEKVIQIQGMHCEHCKQSVISELNKIDGVAAKVELKKNRAIVSFDRPVDDEALRQAVEKAGFKVVSIA